MCADIDIERIRADRRKSASFRDSLRLGFNEIRREELRDSTLLLDNQEIKKEVLGIFADEIYKSLRESEE